MTPDARALVATVFLVTVSWVLIVMLVSRC
jgi:hypothetical protein